MPQNIIVCNYIHLYTFKYVFYTRVIIYIYIHLNIHMYIRIIVHKTKDLP